MNALKITVFVTAHGRPMELAMTLSALYGASAGVLEIERLVVVDTRAGGRSTTSMPYAMVLEAFVARNTQVETVLRPSMNVIETRRFVSRLCAEEPPNRWALLLDDDVLVNAAALEIMARTVRGLSPESLDWGLAVVPLLHSYSTTPEFEAQTPEQRVAGFPKYDKYRGFGVPFGCALFYEGPNPEIYDEVAAAVAEAGNTRAAACIEDFAYQNILAQTTDRVSTHLVGAVVAHLAEMRPGRYPGDSLEILRAGGNVYESGAVNLASWEHRL